MSEILSGAAPWTPTNVGRILFGNIHPSSGFLASEKILYHPREKSAIRRTVLWWSQVGFSCIDGEWVEFGADLDPCPPKDKPCPEKQPEALSECRVKGYEPGLVCNYDYKDTSCDESVEVCTPTKSYRCDKGWQEDPHSDYVCLDYPPDFMHECGPDVCPKEIPESDSPCEKDGLSCDYSYKNTSCEEGVVMCSATRSSVCVKDSGWKILIEDFRCDGGSPSSFFTDCDPSDNQ